jgi:phospholipid/cholesterol/gamma-HCH transport system permease protein
MPAAEALPPAPLRWLEAVGRASWRGLEALGFAAILLTDSLWWIARGRSHGQVVRAAPVFSEMMAIGIRALPIVTLLSATIGLMLALQGIYSLRQFGAEQQVVLGVALGVTREFAPLITGILVAGRSGSALAARLGTMTISNEIDALRVMGVNPVRFLVVPSLLALLVMLPCLVMWSELVGLAAAGVYVAAELGTTFGAYVQEVNRAVDVGDIGHGLAKSAIFAVLIALVGIVDGSAVKGGAEGVGRVTTNAVVHGITAIVFTDMLFVFATTR